MTGGARPTAAVRQSRRGLFALLALLAASVLVVATGFLPWAEFTALAVRVAPVLGFVVAITIVTELAAEAQLFTVLAEGLAKWGSARRWTLWLFIIALATASTVFLSLDTTAVLVTPVVVLLAMHVGVPPLPFALATVWLANSASLLLPVSNLTNLLAERSIGAADPLGFATMVWAPALVGISVPVVVLTVIFRRELRGRYVLADPTEVRDRPLLVTSAVVVAVLLPLLVSGITVWIPAAASAMALLVVFAVRRRSAIEISLVPWRPIAIAAGLFVLVQAGQSHGLATIVDGFAGSGDDLPSLLQLSAIGALTANGINNLPAYLILEPVGDTPVRIAALLIGVNLGPLVTPWASLATLLWHQKIVSLGVKLSWPKFMLAGLVVVVLTVPLATVALWVSAQ